MKEKKIQKVDLFSCQGLEPDDYMGKPKKIRSVLREVQDVVEEAKKKFKMQEEVYNRLPKLLKNYVKKQLSEEVNWNQSLLVTTQKTEI